MLMLIRGIPGSGKSTLAKFLQGDDPNVAHFEADQYFTDCDGNYVWDGMHIGDAHAWCQEETRAALMDGKDVIVSNTFTTLTELRPYFEINKECGGPKLNIVHCQGTFGSIHGVPDTVLAIMKKRFVYDISPLVTEYDR